VAFSSLPYPGLHARREVVSFREGEWGKEVWEACTLDQEEGMASWAPGRVAYHEVGLDLS